MRLRKLEKGESIKQRLLFHLISIIAGARLPDAARIVMYHKGFYGTRIATWTDMAMRGKSNWSVGERELIAAMIAQWNACPFCIDAHGAIAALAFNSAFVENTLKDPQKAEMPAKLRHLFAFLKKMVEAPGTLSTDDIQILLNLGINCYDLEDTIAIVAVFSITVRCANAFDFSRMNSRDTARMARRMLKRGYVRKRKKMPGRPDHASMAEQLRQRVFEGPGETKPTLRKKIAQRAIGGSAIDPDYDELVLLISTASYRITDEHIKRLVAKTGNEKAAFELVIAAAVAVGLYYWDHAHEVLMQAV